MIQLPSTCFAEDEGSLTNSGRWLQWHWAAGTPPGEAKHDTWIMAQLYQRLKALYQKEGGAFPEPIVNLHWPYNDPNDPTPDELAKEINGYVVEDVHGPERSDQGRPAEGQAGRQLLRPARRRQDRLGCWIYSGCFNEQGNNMARRDTSDPDGVGVYPKWAFSWPLNRRILYNRASCDLAGKPWDPSRKLIEWDGAKWSGYDVPDIAPTAKPDVVGPFIMNAEGTARLFTRAMMRDGPFPAHYEPFEIADRQPDRAESARQPGRARVQGRSRPVWRGRQIPLRGDLVPPDRALPLLDQARPGQRRAAAGILRRDFRRAGQGERHRCTAAGCGCGRTAARFTPRRS